MTKQDSLPGLDVEPAEIIDKSHAVERAIFERTLEDVAFKDDFIALLGEGWFWRDAAYIAWKSMPKALRQPSTEDEFCEMIGISRSGMNKRRAKNPAIDQRAAKGVVQATLTNSVDDVVQALIDSAMDSNYKNHPDRKLFLEMSGAYTPKQDIILSPGKSEEANLSEEELRRQALMGGGDHAE